jgi:hypothetical protein
MTEGTTMDGMIPHLVVGQVDKAAGPQPYCTTDMDALRAVGASHAGRVAREAAQMAQACGAHIDADPAAVARARADAAARAAEQFHRHHDTRRAFQADRLRGLRDAGRITGPQYRAAVEIGDLIAWIEAGKQVMARSQFSERMAASTSTVALHQALEEAERLRFTPWRAWASVFPIKPDRSIEQLVRAFVVQGLGVEQAGITFRMDRRRAERLLVRALGCYVGIAGWDRDAKAA